MQPSLVSQYRRLATARQQCGYRYWDMLWESVAFRFALVFTLSVTVGLAVLLLPFHNLKFGTVASPPERTPAADHRWMLPAGIHIGEMRRGLSSPLTIEVRHNDPAPAVQESQAIALTRAIEAWPDRWSMAATRRGGFSSCWARPAELWSFDLASPYAHLRCSAMI